MHRALLCLLALTAPALAAPKLVPDNLVDCTPAGWCRLPGNAPGDSLTTMYSDGPGRFWGASSGGLVVRWDGKKLTTWRLDKFEPQDIWGTESDAWVAGGGGSVARFHAGAWSRISVSKVRIRLDSISGVAGDGAWMTNGIDLFHVDEAAVVTTAPKSPLDGLKRVWVAAPNDVWVVGSKSNKGKVETKVLRFDGKKTWTDTKLPAPPRSVGFSPDIAGSSPSDVWVLVTTPYHWDGKRWTSFKEPDGSKISVTAPDDAFITRQHSIARWNGAKWTEIAAGHFVRSTTIGAGRYATGDYLLVEPSGARTVLAAGSGIQAFDLWAGPDAVYEVGRSKTNPDKLAVARWDGTRWSIDEPGAGHAFVIRGVSSPWFLDGDHGVWHREGNAWKREKPPIADASYLAVLADNDVFVANPSGHVARRTATGWKALPAPAAGTELRALNAGAGSVFAVLERGGTASLARWDGMTFTTVGPGSTDAMDLEVRSATEVIMRTSRGHARWTAGSKELVSSGYYGSSYAIALDGTDTLVAGSDGYRTSGVAIERGKTTHWVEPPVPGIDAISVRDGVVWLMQRESGDLVVRRPATPASTR